MQESRDGSKTVPSAQVWSLGWLFTQIMNKSSRPLTAKRGKGENLAARGLRASGLGQTKPPRRADGLQPSFSGIGLKWLV